MDSGPKLPPQLDDDSTTTVSTSGATFPRDASEGLLEPSLKFDGDTILNNIHKSDQAFAKEVIRLLADRAEHGVFARDSWGYKFLKTPVCILHISFAQVPDFRLRIDHISGRLVGML
jgi:hypothetical protein